MNYLIVIYSFTVYKIADIRFFIGSQDNKMMFPPMNECGEGFW